MIRAAEDQIIGSSKGFGLNNVFILTINTSYRMEVVVTTRWAINQVIAEVLMAMDLGITMACIKHLINMEATKAQ